MAVCLDYQVVPSRQAEFQKISWKKQLMAICVLLIAVGYRVHSRHVGVEYGYQLDRELRLYNRLKAEKKDLEYQNSVLSRHENIRLKSIEKLNYVAMANK